MFRSIYSKFTFAYLLFALTGFLTIALFSDRLTYNYLVRDNAERLYNEAVYMARSYEQSSYYRGDINAPVQSDTQLVANFIGASIWISDANGRIILDSEDRYTGRLIDGFNPAADSSNYVSGNYHGLFDREMLSVEASINHNYTPIGYIIIHYPMSEVLSSKNDILDIVYVTAIIIFALSFIILLIFTFYVYMPLRSINRAAKEYAGGNLTYRMNYHFAHDEIGRLAATLELMADDLSNSEKTQREFIANVSHDFRSPLTSIRGYLEAMADGTIPPEKSEPYMRRIITETERLSKLTQDMLTLSSIDRSTVLNRSDFDINELIRSACNTYENACAAKNLGFALTFEDEAEYVYADFDRIQQVLYNLLDNAIKFSERDAQIYISTIRKGRKIFISVKDTGIGIPKDSIKKIWDRFYKTDISRGRDKTGTGLGLSIVREIIQAHNETIDVVSTEGAGSEFVFSLPMSETESD